MQNKEEGKYQEPIQSNTTPDPGHHMESDRHKKTSHTREPRGQPFPSGWPQGERRKLLQGL